MPGLTLISALALFASLGHATGGPRPQVNATETQALFDAFTALPAIDWAHTESGCFERARLMAEELTRRGIFSVKVFVEDPRGLQEHAAAGAPGYVDSWRYHVAPAVRTESGALIVLDPSVMHGPSTVENWLATLTARTCTRLTSFHRPLGTRCVWYETPSTQVLRPRSISATPVLRETRLY